MTRRRWRIFCFWVAGIAFTAAIILIILMPSAQYYDYSWWSSFPYWLPCVSIGGAFIFMAFHPPSVVDDEGDAPNEPTGDDQDEPEDDDDERLAG
jgi:hypothetical protein